MSNHYETDDVMDYHLIDMATGLPQEDVSCPACNTIYGHKGRKVCDSCEECSKCCLCESPRLIEGLEMKNRIRRQTR